MPKHLILQIETATQVCSIALSANGDTIMSRDVDEPNVHAARLTLLIAEVMHANGLSYSDLAAVAVSKGPGSYTGLRIGVSTAKGLCYAADLPLIGIDTLAGMAEGFVAVHASQIGENIRLNPMVDARRMEVYSAIYDHRLRSIRPPQAVIVDDRSFDGLAMHQKIILFGTGADKFAHQFANHSQVEVLPGFKNSASHLSGLAYKAFMNGDFADVAYFEPYYLKNFVATTPRMS